MSNNRITPFVKRMRTNGGTIYTFSSAVEDIGLNINEKNNIVKISHFALLDIPPIQQLTSTPTNLDVNRFNVTNFTGAFEYEQGNPSIKDGRVLIAESFQNYALNLESNLLNSDDYNPTLIRTVSERVFWKWLKETGAIRFNKDVSVGEKQFWSEEIDADGSLGYNSVVKYVGLVSAGNVRTDSFGTYNETYILVPTSHGQTDAYFEIVEDDNYYHGMEISPVNPNENILGRGNYTLPHPDGLSYSAYYDFVDSSTQVIAPDGTWTMEYDDSTGSFSAGWWYTAQGIDPAAVENTYLTDSSSYINTGIYTTTLKYTNGGNTVGYKRSKLDCLSLVFNLDELKGIYADSALTYDRMAIQYAINDNFNFNAVLIYYSVYNSTGDEVLGRNLLGILFLDAPSGNSSDIPFSGIILPTLEKIQSGPTGFGTSYSLRLNIKTDNMVDDTGATIVDMATSDQLYAEDWTAAFANLNTAVNLLVQNTSVIKNISENYIEVQEVQTQILNDLQALQYQVNDIGRDITGTPNTLALFADGDDPLVDSSVYMKFGNVGIKNDLPQYPLHVSGTTKLDEVIIQNAVRDTSNNILLGYGSPLQLGASTNYRVVDIYTGNLLSAIHIDTSNNIILRDDVSVLGQLSVDGSTKMTYLSVDNITSSSFDFFKSYIADSSVGTQFQWVNGYLEVIASSDVSAAGNTGNIQFNSGGTMEADPSFYWNIPNKRLGIRTAEPSTALHVFGDARIDSSVYLNGHIISSLKTDASVTFYNSSGDEFFIFNANDGVFKIGDYQELGNGGILEIDGANGDLNFSLGGNYNLFDISGSAVTLYHTGGQKLQTTASGIDVSGNISLKTGARTISIEPLSSGLGNAFNIRGQNVTNGNGGPISILGGSSGIGAGGHAYMTAGPGVSGGTAFITGGSSSSGAGGNISIKAGTGSVYSGNIEIGVTDTSAIRLGSSTTIPTGTLGANQVLYVDTADGYRVKRGTAGSAVVATYTNGLDNRIITSTGATGINGEGGLRYDGTDLDVSGNLYFDYSSSRNIGITTDGSYGGGLYILAGSGTEGGGNLSLKSGGGPGFAGGLFITPGSTSGTHGNTYLNGDNSSSYGSLIYFFAGSATTPRLTLSAAALDASVPIKFPARDGYVIQFANDTDTGFYWNNTSRYLDLNDDGTTRFRFHIDTGRFEADEDIVGYSTSISDIRLKENIADLENPLEKILQVRGISYDRKKTGERHLGVIAQEIEKVIPEVVVETTLPLETGDEETLYKTVRYTEIIPYLIEAVKAQQKMIEELRNEINELKK